MSTPRKTFLTLSEEEEQKRKQPTPKEQAAINNLIKAVKALPDTICLSIEDNFWGEAGMKINKRITQGWAVEVASVRKKSLAF